MVPPGALRRVMLSFAKALVPPERTSVSDWLDANRVIGKTYPSPFPGPWRTSRTPYLKEPLDAFDDPSVEDIVMFFSSQIGKTEALLGMLMYAYGRDPSAALYVMPTIDDAEGFSKERLVEALKTCALLKVGDQKTRNPNDAVRHKRINGHPLTLVGSNSTSGLASRPVRRLFCDEIDKFKSTPEGDPLKQAEQRTMYFRRRKHVYSSTPTVRGASRIVEKYENSDQRVWMARCPHCGEPWLVQWRHVRWESGRPETAHLEHQDMGVDGKTPTGCGASLTEWERVEMMAAGWWQPTAPVGKVRGYKTWAVASSAVSLPALVEEWLAAQGKPEQLQTFINLKLGEPWEVPSERVESASLLIRREQYKAEVPAGALVLTAGIDTQDDRLEVLVNAWGAGEECWVVCRASVIGDPQLPETWQRLDQEFLLRSWSHERGGAVRIQCALVDALGHRTNAVYAAVVARQSRRLYASIGKDGGDAGQIVSQPKPLATKVGNVMRCVVDASQVKAIIYARLRQAGPDGAPASSGAGVVHFPDSVGDAFFTELTAEHLITERNKWGVAVQKWAMRPGVYRNESLDCFGMSLAALRVIAPTPQRFAELAARVEAARGPMTAGSARPVPQQPPRPQQQSMNARTPRTRGWSGNT